MDAPKGQCDTWDDQAGVMRRNKHDAAWWRRWWQENKAKYPADVAAIEIPDYRGPLTFRWKQGNVWKSIGDGIQWLDESASSRP